MPEHEKIRRDTILLICLRVLADCQKGLYKLALPLSHMWK